eukprot:CAMPEP_0178814534 /NCGR_PEP_ID=MMETSP0746-20121128/342_1 /TAXON_ID=913974 /ORGANISM="Nitzschia punctata, Strain CCMP561" /LENGTH=111 /DNA_ID=CAMNT_0020475443 /DNA_START=119 /DNA_END=451 /DNA_ORIENTATION=-
MASLLAVLLFMPFTSLVLLTATRRTAIATVRFDGSLRPPRGVCSACLEIQNQVEDEDTGTPRRMVSNTTTVTPLAVGGRVIRTLGPDMTSQHAEYEGLILGLEGVLRDEFW